QVVADLAQDLEPVFASKNQLRQVFLNIIGNARDAMSEGGTLSVKTTSDGAIVAVDISDTGIGIKEEDLDKIFEAFFTTKSSVKGVGLGLSVCYGFIKDHNGDIKVRSTWGSGATFTIILPVYQENAHDSAAA
ncbi:MAG: ATP-binding protein, partial [Desulfobacterales bacterium]|nr:ATP-binding protein [Desulfobacterales bacterium]